VAINLCMQLVAPTSWLPYATEARPAGVPTTAEAVTDEALMLRYRDGDEGAFRALYSRYRAPLLRFTRHLSGHAGDAEEIFQEVWIAVVHSRTRYSVRARFATWLFAIAHRRAADRHRQRARRPMHSWEDSVAQVETSTALATTQPPDLVNSEARQRALQAAIAALPFEQREVFLLRAETGLGVREIASITRSLPETTKSRLRYALRELRKAMAPWS
jgi:RNA polymerase sigma factor (sigma-70 family)